MKISSSVPLALGVATAVAILTGCAGSGPQAAFGPSATASQNFGRAAKNRRSWMAPQAKGRALLYVSDSPLDSVYVYTFPRGKLVGTLAGLQYPKGLCLDRSGDIWVVTGNATVEYAHGGTSPTASLAAPSGSGYGATGCAIDPTTGNLAVAYYGLGVAVYAAAQGTPVYYAPPNLTSLFCTYDDAGNLYVDGYLNYTQKGLEELPKGSSTFVNIKLEKKAGAIVSPGAVQWDGQYLAIGNVSLNGQSDIYQYSISGSVGARAGQTQLHTSSFVNQFWIQGNKVVAPEQIGGSSGSGSIGFFKYPAGGKPNKTVTGLSRPFAAVVSPAH